MHGVVLGKERIAAEMKAQGTQPLKSSLMKIQFLLRQIIKCLIAKL